MNNKCVQDAIEISQAGYWAVTGTGYLMTNWGEGQDSDIEGQRCRLLLCLQSLSHYGGFFFCLLWFMPLDCTLGVMTQLGKSQMVFYQIFMGVPGR